jgi:monoamine oxidase
VIGGYNGISQLIRMARTAALTQVLRALQHALAFETAGITNREGIERVREAQHVTISRRLLLGCSLAGAVSCATSQRTTALRLPSVRRSGREGRVVIVGAGLAGLTAAWRLKQGGMSPTLYDAGGRVGGRAFTLREHFPTKCELGGELIDTEHTAMQSLVREMGLNLVDLDATTHSLEQERYTLGTVRYTEEQLLDLFRPLIPVIRRDLDAVGNAPVSHAHHTPSAEALDALSLGGWFDRNGVRGTMRSLLETAFVSELGRECHELSSLTFLYMIGKETDQLRLYGSSDERFVVREGSDAVATQLSTRLGSALVLSHKLVAIQTRHDNSLVCTFEHPTGVREVVCDRVVLALPFNQLRRCQLGFEMPVAKRRAIEELSYGTNAKVLISTSGRPWRDAHSSGTSFSDGGVYHTSWESTRSLESDVAVMTSYTGGRLGVSVGESNPEAQGRRFAEALDAVYPGTAAAFTGRAARMHWPSARYFEGSYASYGPGDWTRIAGAEAVSVGPVYFAGEHTSAEYQGYMNGAVDSGERAAREVLASLVR